MMCNVFFVDCINFDLCYDKEQEFQTLRDNIENTKNKLEDIKNNLNDINKQIIEIKISEHSMQKSEQHKTPLISYIENLVSYMENYIGRLNELSEHIQVLDKMKNISYLETREAIELISKCYNNVIYNIYNNFRSNVSNFEEHEIQVKNNNEEYISHDIEPNHYTELEEVMKTLIEQNTHNEEQKALKELKDTISSQSVIQITNTNIHNKLPTQHYNNSDPAKIHTVRTILQGVTGIDYKEALGGSGSGSSSSTTTTDTKLHEAYLIPTIQSISSYYANKEISTNHINSKEEEDNVISIDSSDELNDNDNDTDTINKTDKITDIANNDINSEISLSKILLQILSKHCGKSINIENFDDIISSLSKEDIENIILELKKLKNRMKNNEAEIDDIISAFQDILISTNHINTTDNSNIANNTDTINDIDITNTNTTNDDLNTENILIDILFKTLSKHFDKTVNIDNFGDILDELSKEDIKEIILKLKNLKKEMNNNEKEINILINAFQRYM